VIEGGGGLGFTLKTGKSLRVVNDVVGKKFQSDETVKASVFSFVNDAHAATAKFLQDGVVGNSAADD